LILRLSEIISLNYKRDVCSFEINVTREVQKLHILNFQKTTNLVLIFTLVSFTNLTHASGDSFCLYETNMEMSVRFKLVITFIVLNSAYVWSLKENNDISKRLSVLEDMLTEMESIVRETDVKVNKARDKVQDTDESIKRDFSRLEYSTERKQRRHYRRIEKEVKKELKHDSHILNEMIESIEQIQYRNVDNQTRDLTDTDNGLETMHHHVEMNVHQGIAHTEGIPSFNFR
jgi:hypothetical protein